MRMHWPMRRFRLVRTVPPHVAASRNRNLRQRPRTPPSGKSTTKTRHIRFVEYAVYPGTNAVEAVAYQSVLMTDAAWPEVTEATGRRGRGRESRDEQRHGAAVRQSAVSALPRRESRARQRSSRSPATSRSTTIESNTSEWTGRSIPTTGRPGIRTCSRRRRRW